MRPHGATHADPSTTNPQDEDKLLVANAAKFKNWFNVEVRERTEVIAIDPKVRFKIMLHLMACPVITCRVHSLLAPCSLGCQPSYALEARTVCLRLCAPQLAGSPPQSRPHIQVRLSPTPVLTRRAR